jgi:hypothetical protein
MPLKLRQDAVQAPEKAAIDYRHACLHGATFLRPVLPKTLRLKMASPYRQAQRADDNARREGQLSYLILK